MFGEPVFELIVVPIVVFLFSGFKSPIDPFVLFHYSVFDYMCFTVMFHKMR